MGEPSARTIPPTAMSWNYLSHDHAREPCLPLGAKDGLLGIDTDRRLSSLFRGSPSGTAGTRF